MAIKTASRQEFTLEQNLNLPFIGGAAADELAFAKTLVGIDDRVSGDGFIMRTANLNP
ncbi:MAG: hypothetical protein LBU17_04195 [Treponema sp.]|jgi:hypothetical protein|nr:hypothetical protein [Treponema sp.]